MISPDFESAQKFALHRLEQELPANLTYHNIVHTRDDVLPAAERLAALENISAEDLLLLRTAVLFHDIGFVERYMGHEATGAHMAGQVLPGFGYSSKQIQIVQNIILATRLPQSPHTRLEEIMADADLDVIGREDFLPRNQALRNELETFGRSYSDEEWYTSQLKFLQSHQFFTTAAKELRDEQKAQNVQQMMQLLEECLVNQLAEPGSPDQMTGGPMMLSTAERKALLRSVSLFAETSEETLAEVASLLTPIELKTGQLIFHKDDPGDCMYIIVRGRIRVHDGDLTLNHLGPADVFGEMALLDSVPRVASATTVEDTQLLRLAQGPFYELMAHQVEVARGAIRVLNRHLRGRVGDVSRDFKYIQQVNRVTAAAGALEAGVYEPSILDEVGQRTDELGQLARVFQRMANEVQAREQRLKQELQELRIQIDEAKRIQKVAEITGSEYFREIKRKAQDMKQQIKP